MVDGGPREPDRLERICRRAASRRQSPKIMKLSSCKMDRRPRRNVYPSGSNFGGKVYSQCTVDIYGFSQDLITQLYIHGDHLGLASRNTSRKGLLQGESFDTIHMKGLGPQLRLPLFPIAIPPPAPSLCSGRHLLCHNCPLAARQATHVAGSLKLSPLTSWGQRTPKDPCRMTLGHVICFGCCCWFGPGPKGHVKCYLSHARFVGRTFRAVSSIICAGAIRRHGKHRPRRPVFG
jgi:hypothetical protein